MYFLSQVKLILYLFRNVLLSTATFAYSHLKKKIKKVKICCKFICTILYFKLTLCSIIKCLLIRMKSWIYSVKYYIFRKYFYILTIGKYSNLNISSLIWKSSTKIISACIDGCKWNNKMCKNSLQKWWVLCTDHKESMHNI